MTPSRWIEVEEDIASAVRHFGQAVRLHEEGGFDRDDLDGYRAAMALMHAMQSGHTSLESALVRLLGLLREALPVGGEWHADLLRRVGRALQDRPALLTPSLLDAADHTRRFRHVAMRGYDTFEPARAADALAAAAILSRQLPEALDRWKSDLDP